MTMGHHPTPEIGSDAKDEGTGKLARYDGLMELRHLKTFLTVAEAGNFTRAAERLEVTQAAVSQHVATLESRYGQTLFERGSRSVTLTEAGKILLETVTVVFELLDAADERIAGSRPVVTGRLRIASSTVPAEWWLPEVLAGFRVVCPGVRETLIVSDSRGASTAVANGEADVGVVGELPGDERLAARAVAEDELVLVVGVDHPLAKSEQISATDLTTLPLVVRGAGSASQRCVDEALEEAGVHRDQLVTWMETNSVDATRSAVTCGLAAAFLSRRGIAGDLESGRLCHVRVKRVRPRRQLYLVTAVDRVVGTPLREFLEFVESQ
jgi:DNA-binding transcriptional LysR family regulator|tara:strand:+ start:1832 stop:2806 length:975 start_codon:yes stop_codon:yes gene_type:complete